MPFSSKVLTVRRRFWQSLDQTWTRSGYGNTHRARVGAGVARTDDICGAVSGAIMVIGLRYGGTRADDSAAREKTYTVIGEFIRDFAQRNNAVACTALLGYNLSDAHQYAEAKELKVFHARCSGVVRASSLVRM